MKTKKKPPLAWDRCAYCWKPLADAWLEHRGRKYCHSACAAHEPPTTDPADPTGPVADDQLELG